MGGQGAGDPWSGPRTAGRLAFAWSVCLMLAGVVLIVALPPILKSAESGYCENSDHPGPCTSPTEWLIPGLVVLAIAAWCLVSGVALLRHRGWGRWAVAATFSFWALCALAAVVDQVTSPDGVHPGAMIASLLFLGYFASTVVLAAKGPGEGAVEGRTG